MSEVSEIEGLQLQIEELRAQLNTFKLGETDSGTSRQKCAKFRVRWKGPYEVMRRMSDLNYLVKLSRTKEVGKYDG